MSKHVTVWYRFDTSKIKFLFKCDVCTQAGWYYFPELKDYIEDEETPVPCKNCGSVSNEWDGETVNIDECIK